jgi:hypothetical protein
MNVICVADNSSRISLCEFRNDLGKINALLDLHPNIVELNQMCDSLWNDYTDEKWNAYVSKTIDMLRESGCDIIWDR